jgi:antirestriction protein ArdC
MTRVNLTLTTEQLSSLTLENFSEVTGHRFRITRDQKARQISREDAFKEFVASLTPAAVGTPATTQNPVNPQS